MSRTEPTTAASRGKQGAAEGGWEGGREEKERVTEGKKDGEMFYLESQYLWV